MTAVTNDNTNRVTKEQLVTNTSQSKQIVQFLKDSQLRLFAYKVNGRYLCRIADLNGTVISVTSRYILDDAVRIAIGNLRA